MSNSESPTAVDNVESHGITADMRLQNEIIHIPGPYPISETLTERIVRRLDLIATKIGNLGINKTWQ